MQNEGYLSSQTSSKRQPLNRLLTMIVKPLTRGSQQLAAMLSSGGPQKGVLVRRENFLILAAKEFDV